MNKIFKIIWSKTKNSYVVVSEIAKRKGKCSSNLNKKLIAAFLAAGTVLSVTGSAWAANDPVSWGTGKATGRRATAWGYSSSATAADSTAWGTMTKATGSDATAWGLQTEATTESATAFGSQTHATAHGSTAWGTNTHATKTQSTAFGNATWAQGTYATAWGYYAKAGSSNSNPPTMGDTAFGRNTRAFGEYSTAFGYGSWATANGATAWGRESTAAGMNATAFGFQSIAAGTNSTAFGSLSKAFGNNSLAALGGKTGEGTITKTGTGDTATTYSITSDITNQVDNAVAIGVGSHAQKSLTYAIGQNAVTSEADTVAFGNNATASLANSVALGSGSSTPAEVGGQQSMVINGKTYTFAGAPIAENGTVSIGSAGKERTILNVAPGRITSASTDAINGSQLYQAVDAMKVDIVAGDNVEVIKETSDGHTRYTIHSLNAIVKAGENVTVTPATPETTTGTNGQTTDLTSGGTGTGGTGSAGGTGGTGTGGTASEPTPSPDNKPIRPSETNNHTTTYTVAATDTRNKIVAGANIEVKASGDDEKGPVTYTISAKSSPKVKVINGENTTVTEGKDGDFTTYAVKVMTDGKVASGDTGIVTGDTVYRETRVKEDGSYVKKDKTVAENITALDEQVKTNADNIENINNQFNNTYGEISRLDDRMKKGLAGAAALAALHPMDFDPDSKLTLAAGVGNYRSASAGAIGAFYRPADNVMFSLGGSFGNGENMVNAGVSFALDRVNSATPSRTAMAKEITALREQVAKQDEQIARQDEQIAKLTEMVNKLAGREQQVKNS